MLHPDEMIVDNFCGCGGASTAMAQGTEREVDIAINHSPTAIAAHEVNHPTTRHYQEDVWRIDPLEACKGRPIGLAWFSPDCTGHSRAKGGRPRKNKSRGLARLVPRWIKALMPTNQHPRVIMLENVAEFMDWGPLHTRGPLKGQPIKERKGENFLAWKKRLISYGYVVEHRLLVAADYGAPTTRKRLFLVARRDGVSIAWPSPTHGPGRALPWRTAAECIDWNIPTRSIFGRKKELAHATKVRIAVGIKKFVIENPKPYLVTYHGQSTASSLDRPLGTQTTRDRFGLIVPKLAPVIDSQYGESRGASVEEPLPTITAGGMGKQALIAPTLIQTSYGERKTGKPQAPRVLDLHKPVGTLMAGGVKHSIVAAHLTQHNGGPHGGAIGTDLNAPMGTVLTKRTKALTVAHLEKAYGTAQGASLDAPMPTVTSTGNHLFPVTTTLDGPVDRRAEVAAFLLEYAGITSPYVTIDGVVYEITDIGMRMLQPSELLIAQGFPPGYNVTLMLKPAHASKQPQAYRAGKNGVRVIPIRTAPLTITQQVELIGNSVSPPPAIALVRANFAPVRADRVAA